MGFEDDIQERADREERELWAGMHAEQTRRLEVLKGAADGQAGSLPKKRAAARFNAGKSQLHYTDTFPEAGRGVSRVSVYGASKYDPYNYKKGAASSMESYNAARRHEVAWLNGEDMVPDAPPEFGVKHIDAIIWNWQRLAQELVDFPERDDRPHKVIERQESGNE